MLTKSEKDELVQHFLKHTHDHAHHTHRFVTKADLDAATTKLSNQISQLGLAITQGSPGSSRCATKHDLEEMEKRIMLTQQELTDLLTKVDTTTSKIGENVVAIATAQQDEANDIQTISNEIDAFLAAVPPGTVLTQAQADQLQALADKLQTSSDNSDKAVLALQAQGPVLKAIAAKGAPVVPPPPPPVALG